MCFTATRGFHDQTVELFKQSLCPASTGPIIVFGETAPCVSVWLGTAMKDLHTDRRGEVGWGQRERKGERERLRERGEVGRGETEGGRERGRDREREMGRGETEGKGRRARLRGGGGGGGEGEINERERQVQTEEVGSSSVVVPMATWGVALQASLSFS